MPQTPHTERHFTASEVVRDIVIGMSDGLTVPFALAAGLTGGLAGTSNPNGIIVTACLALRYPARFIAIDLRQSQPARDATYDAIRIRRSGESTRQPAASAKGTVNPSDIPITMSRTTSLAVKWRSVCGVCGIRSLRNC